MEAVVWELAETLAAGFPLRPAGRVLLRRQAARLPLDAAVERLE